MLPVGLGLDNGLVARDDDRLERPKDFNGYLDARIVSQVARDAMQLVLELGVSVDWRKDEPICPEFSLIFRGNVGAPVVDVALSQRHERLIKLLNILLMGVVVLCTSGHVMCREQQEAGTLLETGQEDVDVGLTFDALGAEVLANGAGAVPQPVVEKVEVIVVESSVEIIDGFLSVRQPAMSTITGSKGALTKHVAGERMSETSSCLAPAAERE